MANSAILKPREQLRTDSGITCTVEQLLGEGGQGEVYRCEVSSKKLALKWYYPKSATPDQRQALVNLISQGKPDERFLWPTNLVTSSNHAEFGYIMPLRDGTYSGIVDLMKRRVQTTFRSLCTAGFNIADSYLHLHSRGLCYRDISFGNVFFHPENGDVLICDNDNVTTNNARKTSILGTPRFMAPEIVRGETLPDTDTDLYSLSVLLFYLFMTNHPLEGKQEADTQILDVEAQKRIYGDNPVFIFDPRNTSNRPEPGYQQNALIFWPLYPQFLRDLFTRAFTDGLRDPKNGRVRENEWRSAMIKLRDSIFYCPHCKAQNFYDVDHLKKTGGTPALCWQCKKPVRLPYRIRAGNEIIMLNNDSKLFPHHIDPRQKWDFSHPVAEINQHPTLANQWGLRNISREKWVLVRPDGTMQEVEPGRNAPLAAGNKIQFGTSEGIIGY